ncbi:unnamed protein product, partial [Acanthoscelides obtectus]
DIETANNRINQDLAQIEKFSSSHNLPLNPLKTNMLVCANRTKKNTLKRDIDVYLKGNKLVHCTRWRCSHCACNTNTGQTLQPIILTLIIRIQDPFFVAG